MKEETIKYWSKIIYPRNILIHLRLFCLLTGLFFLSIEEERLFALLMHLSANKRIFFVIFSRRFFTDRKILLTSSHRKDLFISHWINSIFFNPSNHCQYLLIQYHLQLEDRLFYWHMFSARDRERETKRAEREFIFFSFSFSDRKESRGYKLSSNPSLHSFIHIETSPNNVEIPAYIHSIRSISNGYHEWRR